MTNEDRHEIVPEDMGTGDGSDIPNKKGPQAFQNFERGFSEDDPTNLAVMKLLLDDKDRLEIENSELKDQLELKNAELSNYQERFHEADKKVAVLEEKSKKDLATEIISVVLFTVGAAMIGYAPNIWQSQPSGWIALVLGAVLIIAGILAKAVKR